MQIYTVNIWAVLVASVVQFAVGAIWFGPKTFYPVWIRALGREVPTERVEMSKGETALMFGGTYLGGFIQALTLALVITLARNLAPGFGWAQGAFFGFVFGAGFTAFGSLSHRLFGQADFKVYQAIKVWLIEVGQDVTGLILAGIILGAWV